MPEPIIKFRSVIQRHKINPYVLVPADCAERLKAGWKKPMPVLVQSMANSTRLGASV